MQTQMPAFEQADRFSGAARQARGEYDTTEPGSRRYRIRYLTKRSYGVYVEYEDLPKHGIGTACSKNEFGVADP
jgi:hypothetical protein